MWPFSSYKIIKIDNIIKVPKIDYHKELQLNTGLMYPSDSMYDKILKECMKTGLRTDRYQPETQCHRHVLFNNGVDYNFWNANKYYSWLNKAEFRKDDEQLFSVDEQMPSIKTVYEFKLMLEDFIVERIREFNTSESTIEAVYQTINKNAHNGNISVEKK